VIRSFARPALLLACIMWASGCAGDGSSGGGGGGNGGNGSGNACVPPETPSVSYNQNVAPILANRCAYTGCHISPNPPEGLNLEAARSYDSLVNVAANERPSENLVTPGDLDGSYCWQKLTTSQGIVGVLMPVGCPGIPPAGGCMNDMELSAVQQWILECAQNN
jgi:hypothetical protein